jgi:DNA polymerase-1
LAEAEDFVAAYFERFPGVRKYLDDTRELAAEQGYVETLLGRRRYFHGLKNQSNYLVKNREEREAINSPIQGTAADIMKKAMLAVSESLKDSRLDARMMLQVHDELVLECAESQVQELAKLVVDKMVKAYKLKVPLQADARVGMNWGKMSALEI